jgi:hypothetical protein
VCQTWFVRRLLAAIVVVLVFCASGSATAQVGRPPQNDAATKAIGILPPTREGIPRILVRALTSTDENAAPAQNYPRVRVYFGADQVACSDADCTESGVVAMTSNLGDADTFHLGIVIDDTVNFSANQSLGAAICDSFGSVDLAGTTFSAWRIGDSTGASLIAGPSDSVQDFCTVLQAALTGRTRTARSPIYQVVQSAVSAMAGDTNNGVRRELIVISDGVDETCVGAADVSACTNDRVEEIVATAIANSIPVSVLLVDASQSGRTVALHHGAMLRSMGSASHGVVRSVSLRADQDQLTRTISNLLRAVDAVAFVPIECLELDGATTTVNLRVTAIQGDGAAERTASAAERTLAAAPLACANQRELCEAAGAMCTPDADTVGRLRQQRNAPAANGSADPDDGSGATQPIGAIQTGDPTPFEASSQGPDDAEGSNESEPQPTDTMSRRTVFSYIALGLALLLILVAAWMWRRNATQEDSTPGSVWDQAPEPSDTASWQSPPPPSLASPPPATRIPGPTASDAQSTMGMDPQRTVDESFAPRPRQERDRTIDEGTAPSRPSPLSQTRPGRPDAPLARLRNQRSTTAAVVLAALGPDEKLLAVTIPRDEYTRLHVDRSGVRSVAASDASLLARFDTGTRAVEVRPGPQGILFVNRVQVSDRAWLQPGDILHCGAERLPVEVRGPVGEGIMSAASLEPQNTGVLSLPRVVVRSAEVRIGRDPEVPPGWEDEHGPVVALPLDVLSDTQRRRISNDHVAVWVSNGTLFVRDLSSNGTLVDGVRIPRDVPFAVGHGKELRLSNEVAFRIMGQA